MRFYKSNLIFLQPKVKDNNVRSSSMESDKNSDPLPEQHHNETSVVPKDSEKHNLLSKFKHLFEAQVFGLCVDNEEPLFQERFNESLPFRMCIHNCDDVSKCIKKTIDLFTGISKFMKNLSKEDQLNQEFIKKHTLFIQSLALLYTSLKQANSIVHDTCDNSYLKKF